MGYGPVIPTLRVSSVPESIAFYVEHLGFTKKWSWSNDRRFDEEGEPDFACIQCDEAVLFLTSAGESAQCSLFIELAYVEDVDSLAERFEASFGTCETPADRPWGSREVSIEDPDGHVIRFSCPLDRRRSKIRH